MHTKIFLLLFAIAISVTSYAQPGYSPGGSPVLSTPIYFSGDLGDKISLYQNRIGYNNNYGFGVGNLTNYSKSYGNYAWLQNTSIASNDNQHDIFQKSIMHLSHNSNDGTILTLREPNQSQATNTGEIRLLEKSSSAGSLYGGYLRYDGANDKIILGTYVASNKESAITINRNSRYVGIGTSSPGSLLDVAGPANLNKGTIGVALRVNNDATIASNGSDFTWGSNGMDNYFPERIIIGSNNPQNDYMLAVDGKILAKEVRVSSNWADFVFEEGYDLPTLQEVEQHIAAHGHLPGVPSADEIQSEGLDLGTIDAKLMQKIEELTLYMIELKKENEELRKMIQAK